MRSLVALVPIILLCACPTPEIHLLPNDLPVAIAMVADADSDHAARVGFTTLGATALLDGSLSSDPDNEVDQPVDLLWSFAELPEHSGLSDQSIVADPEVWGLAGFLPDVLGTYRVRLDVIDSDEDLSPLPAFVVVEAVRPDLQVTLDWDTTRADLDLHLLSPGGAYFDSSDCFSWNPNPDWGQPELATDDPALLADADGEGVGPYREQISLAEPADGTYRLLVHYYADHGAALGGDALGAGELSLSVEISGQEVDRVEPTMTLHEGDVLIAADLLMPQGALAGIHVLTTHEEAGGPPYND